MKTRFLSGLFARLPALIASSLVLLLILPASPAAAARDRQPPTTPTNLRVTGMTPYSVSLAWNPSTDNSGSVTYTICCANVSSETFPGPASTRVYRAGLEAGRTFTLRIFARDAAGNASKYSNTVTFTLPRDTTPPTKSTDDVDPQDFIRYDVYVNGVFDHSLMGYNQTVVYGNAGVENTFQVIAVDSSGNQSAPATLTTCAVAVC